MLTYRYRGHSMSDPAKYRTREEVQKMRAAARSHRAGRRGCMREGVSPSEDELKAIDAEVRAIVTDAAEFAPDDPEPDASELWTDVVRCEVRARPDMPTEILMPALSPTMEEGKLAKWLVQEGDVKPGDIIAEIETDKATMEVEAVDEGRSKILVPAGTEKVKVNTPIAVLLVDGEDRRLTAETRPAAAPQDEATQRSP